jgi:hypothetical protein
MISRISRLLVLALLPCLLAACGVGSAPLPPGELGRKFTATIPGTWTSENSRNGLHLRMVKQYLPDGSARGVLMLKKTSGNVSVVMPEMPFTSRWRVNGDVVDTYSIKGGPPGVFKKGQVIRDTLISVTPNRIVWRANEGGGIDTITRLNSVH